MAGRVLLGPNPFEVSGEADLLHPVRADVAHWSETMYFHVWDPARGVGAFVHTGRWPDDLQLWWAQVIALLPDGQLLVDRSWGRAPDELGPATGNLRVQCLDPLSRWRLRFDGAGELATLAAMGRGPVGAGRAQPFRFDIELSAAAPVWDMHAAVGVDGLSWAAAHHTQGLHASGSLSAGGRDWPLDGVGHRDHSSGPRNFADFGGLAFFTLVFPDVGRVANGLVNTRRDGSVDHRVHTVQQDQRCRIDDDVSVTGLSDLATHEPHSLVITAPGEDGASEDTAAEWLHGYTLTLLEPNENINGAAHDEDPDPLLVTQSTVRATAPDGQIGHGVIERDYRRSRLPAPDPL